MQLQFYSNFYAFCCLMEAEKSRVQFLEAYKFEAPAVRVGLMSRSFDVYSPVQDNISHAWDFSFVANNLQGSEKFQNCTL